LGGCQFSGYTHVEVSDGLAFYLAWHVTHMGEAHTKDRRMHKWGCGGMANERFSSWRRFTSWIVPPLVRSFHSSRNYYPDISRSGSSWIEMEMFRNLLPQLPFEIYTVPPFAWRALPEMSFRRSW